MQSLWSSQEHGPKLSVNLDCCLYQAEDGGTIDVVFRGEILKGSAQHGVEDTNQFFRAEMRIPPLIRTLCTQLHELLYKDISLIMTLPQRDRIVYKTTPEMRTHTSLISHYKPSHPKSTMLLISKIKHSTCIGPSV